MVSTRGSERDTVLYAREGGCTGSELACNDDSGGLGSALGLTTTAEGVENRDELVALQKMGCQMVQGYYFTRPLTATDFDNWWRQSKVNPGLLVSPGSGAHDAIVV